MVPAYANSCMAIEWEYESWQHWPLAPAVLTQNITNVLRLELHSGARWGVQHSQTYSWIWGRFSTRELGKAGRRGRERQEGKGGTGRDKKCTERMGKEERIWERREGKGKDGRPPSLGPLLAKILDPPLGKTMSALIINVEKLQRPATLTDDLCCSTHLAYCRITQIKL